VALTRIQSEFAYQSSSGGQTYYFSVVVDESGNYGVRNIRTPTGANCSSYESLPQSVIDDINTAIGQVENFMTTTSALNGSETFAAETYKDITFATPLASASYRVNYDKADFIEVRTVNKTTTGFRMEVNVTYTGTIGWDLFI